VMSLASKPLPQCTANVGDGSFSTELAKRSLRSAMPPIATEFTRHDESSPSANSRHGVLF
jgi:hypothetical protein